jgi:Uma2 family endonuclease
MATAARPAPAKPGRVVLHDVPWALYVALRDIDANRNVRMAYDDGRLEIMSPRYRHEMLSDQLGMIVRAVTGVLGIPCRGSGSTTFQRPGGGDTEGKAKEPDTSFYLGDNERWLRGGQRIDLAEGDPPPDLAIEVDDTSDTRSKLPIYAALGVPEVWRYDAEAGTVWFLRLDADGIYRECDRSANRPMLTPARVVDWLGRAEGASESEWLMQLLDWVRDELPPAGDGP